MHKDTKNIRIGHFLQFKKVEWHNGDKKEYTLNWQI